MTTTAEVLALGGQVFRAEVLVLWLGLPNPMLDDDVPGELLGAEAGRDRVAALLAALAEGVVL